MTGAAQVRFFVLPAVRCERCGDDMIAARAAPVCRPCDRRAALRLRLGRRADAREMVERLLRGETAS